MAYAHVASNGQVVAADSRGVAAGGNVASGGTGRYCFRGLGFSFRTAQVTIVYGDSGAGGNPNLVAQVAKGNPRGECDSGNQLEVATADPSGGGGAQPAGFFVWFFD